MKNYKYQTLASLKTANYIITSERRGNEMNSVIVESKYNVAISLIRRIRANLLVHNLNIVRFEIKTNSLCKCIGWKRFALYVRTYLKKPRQIST